MRPSIILAIVMAWVLSPFAIGQTAATPPAGTHEVPGGPRAAVPPAAKAAAATDHESAPPARRGSPRPARSRHAVSRVPARIRADKRDGVLALGATDITGNKELPKVMAIVPWKDSLGPGTVVKPTDSLLDEVLAPVDRGAFERRIRYYGQLNAPRAVAPVGDRPGRRTAR